MFLAPLLRQLPHHLPRYAAPSRCPVACPVPASSRLPGGNGDGCDGKGRRGAGGGGSGVLARGGRLGEGEWRGWQPMGLEVAGFVAHGRESGGVGGSWVGRSGGRGWWADVSSDRQRQQHLLPPNTASQGGGVGWLVCRVNPRLPCCLCPVPRASRAVVPVAPMLSVSYPYLPCCLSSALPPRASRCCPCRAARALVLRVSPVLPVSVPCPWYA
ncbi:unnamed protein product [Closterium sp. Naga37s-1]|nr:unnamed protein product [Closterium sp. Naga37s-1]